MHLNDPNTHEYGHLLKNYTDLSFLGTQMEKGVAINVAKGLVDPMTKEPYSEVILKRCSN